MSSLSVCLNVLWLMVNSLQMGTYKSRARVRVRWYILYIFIAHEKCIHIYIFIISVRVCVCVCMFCIPNQRECCFFVAPAKYRNDRATSSSSRRTTQKNKCTQTIHTYKSGNFDSSNADCYESFQIIVSSSCMQSWYTQYTNIHTIYAIGIDSLLQFICLSSLYKVHTIL